MPPDNAAQLTPAGIKAVVSPLPEYAMIGANEGPTPDGKTSINGQGPSSDSPHVIAQSAPFVVQSNPAMQPFSLQSAATQTFLDTFDDAEAETLQQVPSRRPSDVACTLNSKNLAMTSMIQIHADVTSTAVAAVMIEAGHLMDIVPSGGGHGLHMSFTPVAPADFSSGRLLHATMEVDAPNSGNRWVEFNLQRAPHAGHGDLTVRFLAGRVEINESSPLVGATIPFTKTEIIASREGINWGGNGRGIDDRSRFDLFLTTHHYAVFEDGVLATQGDLPAPLLFSVARVQFRHFFYHNNLSDIFVAQGSTAVQNREWTMLRRQPWNPAQTVDYPFTDERHWDNIGFQVLSATAVPVNWSGLTSLIHLPYSAPPVPAKTVFHQ
jgi:hypothetical protein